jgi:hypothetical protein
MVGGVEAWTLPCGRWDRRIPADLGGGADVRPYGRLMVLHITIILGGMAIAVTGAPAAALAILVVLKIAMDVGFHLADHRKRSLPPETVVTA